MLCSIITFFFLLLLNVRATCTGSATSCKTPSLSKAIYLVQHQANKLRQSQQPKVRGDLHLMSTNSTSQAARSTNNSLTADELQRARLYANMSDNVYYLCKSSDASSGADIYQSHGWHYQTRICGKFAFVAIYLNEQGQCLASITGSDGPEDWILNFLGMVVTPYALTPAVSKTGVEVMVPFGWKVYYDLIKDSIKSACSGKPIIAVGHSLGGAAAELGLVFGDVVQSWSFGAPKSLYIRDTEEACPFIFPESFAFWKEVIQVTDDSGSEVGTIPDVIPSGFEKTFYLGDLLTKGPVAYKGIHCAQKYVKIISERTYEEHTTQQFSSDTEKYWYELTQDRTQPKSILYIDTAGELLEESISAARKMYGSHSVFSYVSVLEKLQPSNEILDS